MIAHSPEIGVSCPACGADPGMPCRTILDGEGVRWTHDARVYEALGVRGPS